jgi:hypothetical protein
MMVLVFLSTLFLAGCKKEPPNFIPPHNTSISDAPQFMFGITTPGEPVILWVNLEKRGGPLSDEITTFGTKMDLRGMVSDFKIVKRGTRTFNPENPYSLRPLFNYGPDKDLTVEIYSDTSLDHGRLVSVPSVQDIPFTKDRDAILEVLAPQLALIENWPRINTALYSHHLVYSR